MFCRSSEKCSNCGVSRNGRTRINLKGSIAFFAAIFFSLFLAGTACAAKENACIDCHRDIPDQALSSPVRGMSTDVHTKHALSCSDCHGGDPSAVDDLDLAHSRARSFRGAPDATSIPQFCGRCHSDPVFMKKYNPNIAVDQLELYRTSVHGIKNLKGDKQVAQCTSCHGVHGIRAPDDPLSPVYRSNVPQTCSKCHADQNYMRPYGIPTNQMQEYKRSVHGMALLQKGNTSSPACNGCHGNHGATPPGVGSISEVCGQCHSSEASLFSASPHRDAFAAQELPACEVCHGNHGITRPGDSMLGVSEGSICLNCHDANSPGYDAARTIGGLVVKLSDRYTNVLSAVNKAEQAGMTMDEAKFEANQARDAMMQARTAIHGFAVAAVETQTKLGDEHLEKAGKLSNEALLQVSSRRKGLIAFIIIVALMITGILWRIRNIKSNRGQSSTGRGQ